MQFQSGSNFLDKAEALRFLQGKSKICVLKLGGTQVATLFTEKDFEIVVGVVLLVAARIKYSGLNTGIIFFF